MHTICQRGYDVCLNDIQLDKLKTVLSLLPTGDHLLLEGNYADETVIRSGEKIIGEKWGTMNALVNCAGLFRKSDPVKMEIQEWREVFDIMMNGCFMITQLALKFMVNGGRIVHISSIHGARAELHANSYSVAKAAINQYCRSMALELSGRNILVNAIAPGFVDTAMSVVDGQNELESQWFKDNYISNRHLPLGRAGTADEIAGVAFFLAGSDAAYITGQVILVDGGLSITF